MEGTLSGGSRGIDVLRGKSDAADGTEARRQTARISTRRRIEGVRGSSRQRRSGQRMPLHLPYRGEPKRHRGAR